MAPTGPWRKPVETNLASGSAITDAHPDGHQEERERIEKLEAQKLPSPGKPSSTQLLLLLPDGSTGTAPFGGSTGGLTVFFDPDTDEPFVDEAASGNIPEPPVIPPIQPPTQQPGDPVYPADLIDLTQQKITLPIDTTHAGGPDEVSPPELLTFPDMSATANAFNVAARKYFYLRKNPDGLWVVVMMAPIDGATTSNTANPRSEWREMKLVNGVLQPAAWGINDGKLHRMRYQIAFEVTPTSRPRVCGGQIHDANDDVIEILRDDTVASTPTLTYRLNGSTQPTRLLTNYTPGAYVDMMIEAQNGTVKLYCVDMVNPKITIPSLTNTGCYYKLGCYTQANKTNAKLGEYGQTSIRSMTITHV
jgi:hypothetical protein